MQSRAGKNKPPQHCSSNPQRAPTYSCHRCAQPSLPTLTHCCCFQQWGVPVQHGDTESLPEQTPGANDETINPRPRATRNRTNGAQGQNKKNTPAMPPPKPPRNLDGKAVKMATAAATAAAAAATTSTNKHTQARQGQGSTPIADCTVTCVKVPLKIAGASRAPATILWEDRSDGTLVLQCLKACPPGTDIEVRDAAGDKVDTYQVPLALDEGAKVQIKFDQGFKFMQGQGNLKMLDPDWEPPARSGTANLPNIPARRANVHFNDTGTEDAPPASAAATQGGTKSGAAAAGHAPGVARIQPRRGAAPQCKQDMHIQALNEVAKKALGQNLQLGASSSNKTPQLDMFMRCISLFDVYAGNWRDSPPPPGVLKKLNRECLHGICTELMSDVDPAKVWQHHSHPSCSTHRHKHTTCHPPMQAHASHSTHPAPQPCRHLLTGKVMDITCNACTTTHGDS